MPLKQQSKTVHILGVGESFFGIEQGEAPPARLDHYDFGIAAFDADETRAKLRKRNSKYSSSPSSSPIQMGSWSNSTDLGTPVT